MNYLYPYIWKHPIRPLFL